MTYYNSYSYSDYPLNYGYSYSPNYSIWPSIAGNPNPYAKTLEGYYTSDFDRQNQVLYAAQLEELRDLEEILAGLQSQAAPEGSETAAEIERLVAEIQQIRDKMLADVREKSESIRGYREIEERIAFESYGGVQKGIDAMVLYGGVGEKISPNNPHYRTVDGFLFNIEQHSKSLNIQRNVQGINNFFPGYAPNNFYSP